MNAQHIPAPWQIDVRPDSSMEIQTQSGIPIAVLCLLRERDANARLIAAAPDLLESLGDLLSFCEKAHHDSTILTNARNAISKATGQ